MLSFFVRREEEEEGHVRHCSGSLNAKNREFKRVLVGKERTRCGKMRSGDDENRLLESGSRFDILFKCGYEVELGSLVILLRG